MNKRFLRDGWSACFSICLQYGDSLPKKDGPSYLLLLLPFLYKVIILPGCELHSSPLTWLSSPSVCWPTSLWLNEHAVWSDLSRCDVKPRAEYATVFDISVLMPAGGPTPPPPLPLLSQETTGTQAPVAGVALRGPLSGDMVASCQRCAHTSSLVKLHTVTASPQQKQEGSPEITTRIERSITHHACKMLNVFIRLVRGNLRGCECALSCVALVFWGWLSPKPRACIGMSQKRKCIHFYFYTLPKGMLM